MIKKLKLGLLIAVLSLVFGAGSANAANLTFSSDTPVTINGSNYTIAAGSGATSMTLDSTTLTVVTDGVTSFSLLSPDRFLLTNNQAQAQVCTSTQNSVTVTAALTTIFTPDNTSQCAFLGGSGGLSSGGGSGGTSSGDTTAPSNVSVSINAGANSTSSLSASLTLNATDAVGVTQMMISNDVGFAGASWETYATSKSWMLVSGDGLKTVYARFRDAAGNISSIASDTITLSGSGTITPPPATIIVNPIVSIPGCNNGTNGFSTVTGQSCAYNYVTAGMAIPGCNFGTSGFSVTTGQSCIGNTGGGVTWYNFGTVTLRNGSVGAAVMELQRFLNRVLNLGLVVDGKLGPKTIAVIKKWQAAHGLVADGLVGPKTKAAMNASIQ